MTVDEALQGVVLCDDGCLSVVRIPRRPLADEIRLAIREMILSGELKPGQRLTEQQVARDMGTSQGPVREAFASLTQEGLLLSLPHRGTFVSTVSETEAHMAYALRELIEPYVVGLALPKLTEEVFRQLEGDIVAMRESADASDVGRHAAADAQFHGRLYALAGTEVLSATWQMLSATIRQFVTLVAPHYVHDLNESTETHVTLLRLLREGDRERVQAEVAEHGQNIWRRMAAAADEDETLSNG